MAKMKILLLLALLPVSALANICFSLGDFETAEYSFNDNIVIPMSDGVEIHGNVFIPKNTDGPIPTVIFVNSWTVEEHEYINQSKILAKAGYQVFSYSARGWGCSTGKVDVIGPRDMQDLSTVVDWLEENTNVDIKNIGMSGISYGSGMSLMGAVHEPRIKAVAAMSTWGSLEDAVYHQNTPRLFWASTLMATGWLTGELDRSVLPMFKSLITHKDIEPALTWARERSPLEFVEKLNQAGKPIYLSNNFGDNLFQPNNVLKFFRALKTPKVLDLNQGTHATGEISGLFTTSNYSFKRMRQWFDYWLKGEGKGLETNQITLQTDLKHKREIYTEEEFFNRKPLNLSINSRNILFNGGISLETQSKEDIDIIYSGADTRATSGVPILSAIIDSHFKVPVFNSIPWIQRLNGVYYKSPRLKEKLKIRGIPKVTLTTSSEGEKFQLVAYLYDVNPFGLAKLITHGALTKIKDTDKVQPVEIEMVATAYDIPKGNRLAIAIDTEDILYARPIHVIPYKTEIHFGSDMLNKIELPLKN